MESRMILQIGGEMSRYSNYKKHLNDSITVSHSVNGMVDAQEIMASMKRIQTAGDLGEVFENYPSEGRLLRRKPVGSFTSYEEDIPDFSWTVEAETANILGYECQKAVCSFRGRDYVAWFAPDIPIGDGPWKFGGLLGLIMKVTDSRGMFRFEAVSIYKPS